MWQKIAYRIAHIAAWCIIIGYLIYSIALVREHRNSQIINRIEISILDSAMHGNLITTPMVEEWITRCGVEILGRKQREIPISTIEQEILKNGFVKNVSIYPTYRGVLCAELTQHRPTLRLLIEGYNGYATREGYIFEAPHFASLYVPVVTGSYTPPFPARFKGNILDYIAQEELKIEGQIKKVEREKYPLYEREKQNIEDLREVRQMRIKKGWMESAEKFDMRVIELRAKKAELRRLYRYRNGVISKEINKLSQRQHSLREEQKKLTKRYVDFMNLITFAHIVEQDKFWGSEIVQIIAKESEDGGVRVSFMVRSGEAEIIFGSINDEKEIDEKFEKLMEFYQNVLRRVGWNRYKSVNVEYKGQVVCK